MTVARAHTHHRHSIRSCRFRNDRKRVIRRGNANICSVSRIQRVLRNTHVKMPLSTFNSAQWAHDANYWRRQQCCITSHMVRASLRALPVPVLDITDVASVEIGLLLSVYGLPYAQIAMEAWNSTATGARVRTKRGSAMSMAGGRV
jgi:hypothetical protein